MKTARILKHDLIKRNCEENSRGDEDGKEKLNNPIRNIQWEKLPSGVGRVEGRISGLRTK